MIWYEADDWKNYQQMQINMSATRLRVLNDQWIDSVDMQRTKNKSGLNFIKIKFKSFNEITAKVIKFSVKN